MSATATLTAPESATTAGECIALPLTADLTAAFRAVLPFASKDAVSLVLTTVRVSQRYLTATDRYAIARYEHTTYDESVSRHGEDGPTLPDFAVLLPREAVEWVGKLKPTGGQVLNITAGSVTVNWSPDDVESALEFEPMHLNFPPVERLISEPSADAVEVSPFAIGTDRLDQLVKAGKALARVVGRNAAWRFQLPDPRTSHKNAPVRATLGERMVTMLQPMLNVR